ncbi:histone H1-like [Erpetoichthys calabaricus]|nr:histone H1-like [Erpetoichthys calabaricus]
MAETAPAAAPKKKASAKPKMTGPSVSDLIVKAVSASKERHGLSFAGLKKALAAGGYDVEKNNARVKLSVKSLVSKGSLVQTKGTGASGSFKINKQTEAKEKGTKKKAAPKKPAAKKPAAAKKVQKPAAKKPATAKKTVKPAAAAKKSAKSPKKAKPAAKPKKTVKSPKKAKVAKAKAAKLKTVKRAAPKRK